MKEFPKDIKFIFGWRRYQKRVLDELEANLEDNHLHIIAAPGSGKTVLGLEVAIRLNKPTLIFAPTVAIRNQWIQRLCELFLQQEEAPEWISQNIKKPAFLTVVTYQGLHAACTNTTIKEEMGEEENENETNERHINKLADEAKEIDTKKISSLLKAQKVGTIILDEAHHLKNEWWKDLMAIKEALNPTIVGLTATPPYDVSFPEWQRYLELNGPVDAEITAPELVVEGDLCPHQDYIFLSTPTKEENHFIFELRQKAIRLFDEILKDETLITAILSQPVFQEPAKNLEWIYNNLDCYSATLIFLHATGKPITKAHLEIIGDRKFKIPELNYEWLEILLTFYLFKCPGNFVAYREHQEKLINKLQRNGLLERKCISFRDNPRINHLLSTSLSKLKSIDDIVDVEHDTLGNDLRMVILTDYIRKEFLINGSVNSLPLNKIGVIPIFEQLRRTNDRNMKLGILSGSLIIIPLDALDALKKAALRLKITDMSYTQLPYDAQYVILNSNEQIKHDIVRLITQIFEQGEIQVLIGTKSLLGEGWDAPSINSLILASFVGSYVLSNQMRGRAIRSDKRNPGKTGNIWHLVCVDDTTCDGGDDIKLLKRRFKSFVGISFNEDVSIENGISRLNLPESFNSTDEIINFNSRTIKSAGQRDQLIHKWSKALKGGVILTEEIKIPFPDEKNYHQIKSMYYNKTIRNLFAGLCSGVFTFFQNALDNLSNLSRRIKSPEDFFMWLKIIGIVGVVIFGRRFYKTFRLFIKYRDISKDIQQIGETLLESMVKVGTIHTEYSKLQVVSSVDTFGAIYCHLDGGTTYEKSAFIKSLHEIVGVVNNPKYLILRKSLFLNLFSQKDYHAVPEIIGQNKKTAEYFERQWRRFVGACELIYTRTIEGRKILLKSRIHSLSSEFEDKTERINKWR